MICETVMLCGAPGAKNESQKRQQISTFRLFLTCLKHDDVTKVVCTFVAF